MVNERELHAHDHHTHVGCFKCISWAAIFAGAFVGIGIAFLLNIFSVAIGLSAYSMVNGVSGLAVGGFVGLLIGGIVSMFVSGWVAGYLGRHYCPRHNLGVLYGFLAWSLALIITILMAAHATQYLTNYSRFIINPVNDVVVSTAPATSETPAAQSTAQGDTVVNADAAARSASVTAFMVFVLFFIGAVSACFGGHYGMICKERDV